MRLYFYRQVARYLRLFVRQEDVVELISPSEEPLRQLFAGQKGISDAGDSDQNLIPPDYIVVSSDVHYQPDIQSFLSVLHARCAPSTRLIMTYYSSLWRPLLQLATRLGLRRKTPEQNWVSHEDMENLLKLADFEIVRVDRKILIPVYIPIISWIANRFLASLPILRHLTLVNLLVARPVLFDGPDDVRPPSVSVVVPARNEAGNIEGIVQRLPLMGPEDELIFVEGNSTDETWATIQQVAEKYAGKRNIVVARQEGKGKGDAVRKGFDIASREILMILDADMTVSPEELPKFYQAIIRDKGEFINGSRLVYPMEGKAMRFLNMLANKFFAVAFSFVVGQSFKDTLCGTKVITRDNYRRLANHRSFFGDFDPFGDFDLIFGAARMGLKIVEVPITYKDRTYGTTNISRWSHGLLLFKMLGFAALRLRFL